jgi:hypothetical protein
MEQAQKESLPFIPESFPLSFFLIITTKKKQYTGRKGADNLCSLQI